MTVVSTEPQSPRAHVPTRRERARAATIEEIKTDRLAVDARAGDDRPAVLRHRPGDGDDRAGALPLLRRPRRTADRDDRRRLRRPRRRGRRRPADRVPSRRLGGRSGGRAGLPRLGSPRAAAIRADPGDAGARLRRARGGPDDRGGPARDGAAESAVLRCRRAAASCSRPWSARSSAGIAACARPSTSDAPEIERLCRRRPSRRCCTAWASLHGFTCLEAYGHLDWMTDVDRDALFRSHVRMIAMAAGIPAPPA